MTKWLAVAAPCRKAAKDCTYKYCVQFQLKVYIPSEPWPGKIIFKTFLDCWKEDSNNPCSIYNCNLRKIAKVLELSAPKPLPTHDIIRAKKVAHGRLVMFKRERCSAQGRVGWKSAVIKEERIFAQFLGMHDSMQKVSQFQAMFPLQLQSEKDCMHQ